VARYQQLRKQWCRDPFLSKPRHRKHGYQEAFAVAHERERAELELVKASNKVAAPPSATGRGASSKGAAAVYVPPGQKRRDRLRWNVRMRMQLQD
jgi:hypothetical protein